MWKTISHTVYHISSKERFMYHCCTCCTWCYALFGNVQRVDLEGFRLMQLKGNNDDSPNSHQGWYVGVTEHTVHICTTLCIPCDPQKALQETAQLQVSEKRLVSSSTLSIMYSIFPHVSEGIVSKSSHYLYLGDISGNQRDITDLLVS